MLNEDSLTHDLTQLAESGELEPTYGRVREIFAILEIMARTKSKNVMLVGHEGVGKRRIIEGLAMAGVTGETQGLLDDFRLIELDLGLLAAMANKEGAVISLLKHMRKNRDIIMFIDDIHLVMESESSELGTTNFEQHLKPMLARGDITCIGSTTPEKYRQLIQPDVAVRAQFETISVEPMSEAETFEVLKKLQPRIETHHNLRISEKALRAAVLLTEQYLTDRYLPGKAIEVIDQACARYRYKSVAGKKHPGLIEDASLFMLKEEVSPHDVRKVVQSLASVSMDQLALQDRWKDAKAQIQKQLFGQDMAVSRLVRRLRKAHEALSDSHRPEAIFLFLGPRGVGKRFLAQLVAEILFGSRENLLAFDMSLFEESAFCSTLLDEDMTRVGPNDTGKTPYFPNKVLLFNNIEDADTSAFEYLVPVLEEGRLTAPNGREVVLKNAVIIFSSMEDEEFPERAELEANFDEWVVGLRQVFRPAFFNQIDEVIPFFPLQYEHLYGIMRSRVNALRKELEARGIHVGMHKAAYLLIAKKGYQRETGIKRLLETLDEMVLNRVREMAGSKRMTGDAEIHVLVDNGSIVFGGSFPKLLEDTTAN